MADKRNFGPKSTTQEVLAGIDLSGKTALVTGASGGLGAETGRALAAAGARVLLTARDRERGEKVARAIRDESPGAAVEVLDLELGSFASVRSCAEGILAREEPVDLLINNAGIMGCPLQRTVEGHEMQFGTCHVGHFLLTTSLLPALHRSRSARVINLTSAGHFFGGFDLADPDFRTRPYDKWLGYGQAKTANILFTVAMEARFAADLGRHLEPADLELLMGGNDGKGFEFKSVPAGAATTCWAASAPELDGVGGRYLLDCRVAEISEDPTVGVAAFAMDADQAEQLWALSEAICGTRLS